MKLIISFAILFFSFSSTLYPSSFRCEKLGYDNTYYQLNSLTHFYCVKTSQDDGIKILDQLYNNVKVESVYGPIEYENPTYSSNLVIKESMVFLDFNNKNHKNFPQI